MNEDMAEAMARAYKGPGASVPAWDAHCESFRAGRAFAHEGLRAYLDDAITQWREKVKTAATEEDDLTARCYVDAFQSARVSILGELLPPSEDPV